MSLNQTYHFNVVVDTNKQIYSSYVDGHALAEGAEFNNDQADGFVNMGIDTFWDSTSVIGIDNILIKGSSGTVLPGVNLLLLGN